MRPSHSHAALEETRLQDRKGRRRRTGGLREGADSQGTAMQVCARACHGEKRETEGRRAALMSIEGGEETAVGHGWV